MNKNFFDRKYTQYGVYGIIIGLFIILFAEFVGYTKIGIDFLLALMYLPTEIISFFRPCPLKGFGCLYYGVDFAIFTAPIYLGILGFLIGLLIEKLKNKKK